MLRAIKYSRTLGLALFAFVTAVVSSFAGTYRTITVDIIASPPDGKQIDSVNMASYIDFPSGGGVTKTCKGAAVGTPGGEFSCASTFIGIPDYSTVMVSGIATGKMKVGLFSVDPSDLYLYQCQTSKIQEDAQTGNLTQILTCTLKSTRPTR